MMGAPPRPRGGRSSGGGAGAGARGLACACWRVVCGGGARFGGLGARDYVVEGACPAGRPDRHR